MPLVSPGVSVSVIDQSVYAGAGPGTVPLLFIATQENKSDPTGAGLAVGTLKQNAGLVYSITSQRDLVQTFGDPTFYSIAGSSVNGYPLNEYGLLAAYSFLGISNLCRVVRADINTAELEASPVEPTSAAAVGTYWFDETESAFGLFMRTGTYPNEVWTHVAPTYIINAGASYAGENIEPTVTGTVGEIAVVFSASLGSIVYWVRASSGWAQLGTNPVGDRYVTANSSGTTITIDDTSLMAPGMLVRMVSGSGNFAPGTKVVSVDSPTTFTVSTAPTVQLQGSGYTQDVISVYPGVTIESLWPDLLANNMMANYWVKTGSVARGANIVLRRMDATLGQFVQVETPILADAASADIYYSTNQQKSKGQIYVGPIMTGLQPQDTNTLSFNKGLSTAPNDFAVVSGIVGATTAPTNGPLAGRMWFNALVGLDNDGKSTVDILMADGTGGWQNIQLPGFTGLFNAGATTLYTQSADPRDEVGAPTMAQGDIWVDTDVQPYPVIKRWSGSAWVLVDLTDQTTPNGIIFTDARPAPDYVANVVHNGENNGGPGYPDLDPDAPDSDLYPRGFLLWNTRYSTNNVKQWDNDFVFGGVQANLYKGSTGRWVTASGNNPGGVPYMGAAAQNIMVVRAIQSVITDNEDIRAEDMFFNLIAAPGYVEAIDEMLVLNEDRKETAFVVGDTPFTLAPTGTALQAWASNSKLAFGNGSTGLVSASKHFGVWYPSGLATNLDGVDVVVPPSHMALRTIAYNDQVAYPWFAPAGLQRGVVNNAASVGYVNASGQYVPVKLSEGQRDILYQHSVNPIRTMPAGGIVVFGQKTRQAYSSATDRINVVRLEHYLRYTLDILAQPFLFEPNDTTTRKAVKDAFDRAMSELITLRGLYDFLVVCDTSNNTPARIDRNELWIDIAIQPVKAIEYIYIPIRIRNTGASLS